jgi:HPt (histidine-containing phosphotransfer) domain-containing protein
LRRTGGRENNPPMHPPPSLDEEALAKLLRIGGPKFAGNMVDLFLDFAPTKLAAAVAAERKGDWQGVEDAMHPLRTCAGHVGAVAVRTLAVEIEDLAHAGDSTAIALRLAALEQALGEVKPRLLEKRASFDTR